MQTTTFSYNAEADKWSVDDLPNLDSRSTLVLVAGASTLVARTDLFQQLRRQYPTSLIAGCSTGGEITGGGVHDGTLSVAIMRFNHTRIETKSLLVRSGSESHTAGQRLVDSLNEADLRGVLVFADGLKLNMHDLAKGLDSRLGQNIPLLGVLAADGTRYQRSWVCVGDRLQSGIVVGIGFYGESFSMKLGSGEAWGDIQGGQHQVTKAHNNVLLEVDGQPALDAFRNMIKDAAGGQPKPEAVLFPIAVLGADGQVERVVPIVRADPQAKSVTIAGIVSAGTRFRVVKSSRETLLQASSSAAETIRRSVQEMGNADVSLVGLTVSSVARRVTLGKQVDIEVSSFRQLLPENTPDIGLYSYGQIALGGGAPAVSHEDGITYALLSEEAMTLSGFQAVPGMLPQDGTSVPAGTQTQATEGTQGYGTQDYGTQAQSTQIDEPATTTSSAQSKSGISRSRTSGPTPPSETLNMPEITIEISNLTNLQVIRANGRINERFQGKELGKKLRSRVVFDLTGVERITSFGVREWLGMMSMAQKKCRELYFANCSEAIVNQMMAVRNFSEGAHIASFSGPYVCSVCSKEFDFVLDCANDAEAISSFAPPDVACPECGNRAYFDDEPESYFEFALPYVGQELPRDVRSALREQRMTSGDSQHEGIEKIVTDEATIYTISRDMDHSVRWVRLLDGLEGEVRFDFEDCKNVTKKGASVFATALRNASVSANRISLDNVPPSLLEQMSSSALTPSLDVRSLSVWGLCPNCGVTRRAVLDADSIREAASEGHMPDALCRRCNSSLAIGLSSKVLGILGGDSAAKLVGPGSKAPTRMIILIGAGVAVFVASALIGAYAC